MFNAKSNLGRFIAGSLVIIGLFCIDVAAHDLGNAWRSRGWRPVAAEVVEIGVLESGSEVDGVTFRPEIEYRFEVDGEAYSGDRITYFPVVASGARGEGMAERAVARFPQGETILVYYNPRNPNESMVERGLSPFSWVSLVFGMLLLGGGLYGYIQIWRDSRNQGE